MSSSLSWVVADLLMQLESLALGQESKTGVPEKEVRTQLQKWIQRFALPSDMPVLCSRLLELAKKTERNAPPDVTPVKTNKKPWGKAVASNLPRKGDGEASIDEKTDSSWIFFVLQTLGVMFEAVMIVPDREAVTTDPSRLNAVPPAVIKFCFDHLAHTSSLATRTGASKCLGVLSERFLDEVVGLFVAKMKDVMGAKSAQRDTEEREFSSYQRAVANIQFGLEPTKQAATMLYLQTMLQMMHVLNRTVLQNAVCNSLSSVIPRITGVAGLDATTLGKFHTCYLEIFQVVVKWSSESTLRDAALNLLWKMEVHCGDYEFYKQLSTHGVFGKLVKSFSKAPSVAAPVPVKTPAKQAGKPKKQLRLSPLKAIIGYLRKLPQAWVDKDTAAFSTKVGCVKDLIRSIKNPEVEEQATLAIIIEELGMKHLSFVLVEVMQPVLYDSLKIRKDELDARQKCVLLVALGKLARAFKVEITTHFYWLGPVLSSTIKREPRSLRKGDKKERTPDTDVVIAALKCFPHVRPVEERGVEEVAAAVGALTLKSEYGVASQAVQAMQELVELDQSKYLIPTLFCYIDILAKIDSSKVEQCKKVLQILGWLVTQTRTNLAKEGGRIAQWVSPSQWVALRQHFEGASLMWLVTTTPEVRHQVALILALFCSHDLRVLEGDEAGRPSYLVDALFPDGDTLQAMSPAFRDTLSGVIVNQHHTFRGVLSWTWTKMFECVDEALPVEHKLAEEPLENQSWYPNYLSKIRFLCIALRMPAEESSKRKIVSEAKDEIERRPHIFCPPPLLTDFSIQNQHAKLFFKKIFTVLHLPWQYKEYTKLCGGVAIHLASVHPSCYKELLSNLRRPLNEKDGVPSPLRKGAPVQSVVWPKQEFYHHQETIAVIALLLLKNKEGGTYTSASAPPAAALSALNTNAAASALSLDALNATVDTLISNWLQERKAGTLDVGKYRCKTRCYMADLIARSILHGKGFEKEPNAAGANQSALFELLTSLLEPEERDRSRSTKPVATTSTPAKRAIDRVAGIVRPGKAAARRLDELDDADMSAADENDPAAVHELEAGILQGVYTLIHAVGPKSTLQRPDAKSEERDRQLLQFVFKMGFRTECEDSVAKVLEAFLYYHSNYVEDFMAKSFALAHMTELNRRITTTAVKNGKITDEIRELLKDPSAYSQRATGTPALIEHAQKMAGIYAKAVVGNFIKNLGLGGMSLARVLLFCMLQQASSTPSTRSHALALAAVLAKERSLDPGYPIRVFSHEAVPMYTQATVQYSTHLASRAEDYPNIVSPLFQEAAAMILSKTLDLKYCELLLRLITPWTSFIGVTLQEDLTQDKLSFFQSFGGAKPPPKKTGTRESGVEAKAGVILQSLYNLTTHCYLTDKVAVTPLLQSLWTALLSEQFAPIVVPQVVRFLVLKYTEVQQQKEASAVNELPKMLLLQLSRSRDLVLGRLIVDELLKHIRNCPNRCPVDLSDYLEWQEQQQEAAEDITPIEKYAFELVGNLVFENGALFSEHFPTLLQNAAVMLPNTPEAEAMLSFIALTLGINSEDGQHLSLDGFVEGFCQTHLNLAKQWSRVCIEWAINSKSNKVATASLKMFQKLERAMQEDAFDFAQSQTVLIQLASGVYLALRLNQIDRVHALVEVMSSLTPFEAKGWISLTSIGWAMLCFSDVRYFKTGLSLMLHMFDYDEVSFAERKELISSGVFFRRLATLRPDEDKKISPDTVDKAIAEVALKGLTSATTCQGTLSVLQTLAPFFPELPHNNRLMGLLLLGNVLMRSIDFLETSKEHRAHSEASKQQLNQRDLYHISRVRDCLSLSALLETYKKPSDPSLETHVKTLSQSMLGWAKASAEHVEGVKKLIEPEVSLADTTARVEKELVRCQVLVSSEGVDNSPPRASMNSSHSHPRIDRMLASFFAAFAPVFSDRGSFDFVVDLLTNLLKYGPKAWNMLVIQMIGLYLKHAPQKTTSDQFVELSVLLVSASASAYKDVERLSRDAAFIMTNKTDYRGSRVFNFEKPAPPAPKPGETEVLMSAYTADKETFGREMQDCLSRIGKQTFDVLKWMREHPRLGRPGVLPTIRPSKQARLHVPLSPTTKFAPEASDAHIRFPCFNSPTEAADSNGSPRFPSEDDLRMKYNMDEDENYLSDASDDEKEPLPRSPISSSVLVPGLSASPNGNSLNKKRKPEEVVSDITPVSFHLRSLSKKSPPQLPARTPPPKPSRR